MAVWKGSKIMEEYSYILFIALILLSTKILGLVTKKMKLPQVVGALLAGHYLHSLPENTSIPLSPD